MIKKKICMLGAFAVGKTSLVQQFVHSIFTDRYQTTVGVKIDKKSVAINSRLMDLILWDLNGEDEFQEVRSSYLRGSAGCLYVIDGTRAMTAETALNLQRKANRSIGNVPSVFVVNKLDLLQDWEISDAMVSELKAQGAPVILASARTGHGVERAFRTLAETIIMGD